MQDHFVPGRKSKIEVAWQLCLQVAQICRQPGQKLFLSPWVSPACQCSFRIPAGYLPRWCPQNDADWTIAQSDQQEPHHFVVYAHLHTGLGWISGIALPSLLPSDL